jgi:hypothetical protein
MLATREVLKQAFALGLKLGFEPPNTLTFEPTERCPGEFRETLRHHNPQLIALLRSRESLSKHAPLERRLYVVRDRDGDYLCQTISTGLETVPLEFQWTPHRHLATRYTNEELNSRFDTVSLMQRVIHGHAGAEQIRVQ